MIQHQYRRVNPPTMIPSCDAVCPRCRHVFPVSAVTSHTPLDKLSPASPVYGSGSISIPEYCPLPPPRAEYPSLASYPSLPDLLIPPVLPPRPKLSKSPLYVNVPPPTTPNSSSSTSISSTKAYVTMSNINLPLTAQALYNGRSAPAAAFDATNTRVLPNFVPLPSPTYNTHPSILPSLSPNTCNPPTTATTIALSTPAASNGRVYRQLSGGGLIDQSTQHFRIHEPQPMHQLSGGGLVAAPSNDPIFPPTTNSHLPMLHLPLGIPSTEMRESKSTRLLISTTSDTNSQPSTSISISGMVHRSNSPTISIVVPSCSNSSVEISMKNIAINLPPSTSPPVIPTPTPASIPFLSSMDAFPTNRWASPSNFLEQPMRPTPPITLPSLTLPNTAPTPKPIDDMQCLTKTINCLKESGWFHEGLSWNDSEALLAGSANGTFIVRESSNPSFLFAITVQTSQQPTSVRIQYDNGRFRLDCVSHVTPIVPQFNCLVDLIEYYVTQHEIEQRLELHAHKSGSGSGAFAGTGNQVFVDEHGHINSIVSLKKPLRSAVPSLMHCARLSVNKQLKANDTTRRFLPQNLDTLELPSSLKNYLLEYPNTL